MSEPIHDSCTIEIEPCRRCVLQGMEAGALGKGVSAEFEAVPAEGFEQRMPRCNPFEVVFFSSVAIRRQAWVAGCEFRKFPTRLALEFFQAEIGVRPGSNACAMTASWVFKVRAAFSAHSLMNRAMVSGTTRRSCARARRSMSMSRLSFLEARPFERRLADGPEMVTFVHILQEPILEIGVAQLARVVVPKDSLNVGGRQDLADNIEHCIVIEGIADLLKLLVQTLEDPSLNGVGRDKVEDQAIVPLPVAVDTTHSLFEPIRVPRDVVVEEDMAALQVDAFARRLGCNEDLDVAFTELPLGVEPGSRLIAGARLHAAMDATDAEAPSLQLFHQVVRGCP